MNFKKMIVSIGIALLMCLNCGVVSYANTISAVTLANDGIAPAYEIASSCTSSLTIQNGTAHCTSIAKGTDAVNITVTHTLQKYWGLWIWEDVNSATWTKNVDDNSVCLYNTKPDIKSGKYRVKSTFVLTDGNGETETITIYSDKKSV